MTFSSLAPVFRRSFTGIALAIVVVVSATALAACDSGSVTDTSDIDRTALLNNYGSNIILPAYETLQNETDDLNVAAEAFVASPSVSTLAEVRTRLRAARLAWQDANLFQFGPAENVALRGALNTYPTDEDQIDDNVASGSYTLGSVNNQAAGGFPAVGYLLYGVGASDEEIVAAYTDGSNADGLGQYLADNTAFIKSNIDQVVTGWQPSGGDYLGMFTSEANAGTDVGSSLGMLINALVLHYERFARDGKVGIPAGVRSAGVARPTATEAHYGGYSLELARANVEAIKRLYQGTGLDGASGTGLDDNLRTLDAAALDTEIANELDGSMDALSGLSDPLANQIEENNDPVLAAFQEMQDVVVLLKADMTSVLGVTITFQDNDGD